MEVDSLYYELKLQSLLEKFLEKGYRIKNDVYFNRFQSFLDGSENEEVAERLLKLPLLSEWILRAVSLWESDPRQMPDPSVAAVALHILGLVSKNEKAFESLSKADVHNRIVNVLHVRNVGSLPSIKLGFIRMMTFMIRHSRGREWLLATNYWQEIYSLALQNQTVYIRKEGHFFLASFLESILIDNEEICARIWQVIAKPLLANPNEQFRNSDNLFEASDEEIESFLGPTVCLINDILEYFFDKSLEGDKNRFDRLKRFKSVFSMSCMMKAVENYLHLCRNETMLYEFSRVWILLLFVSMNAEKSADVDGAVKLDIDKEFLEPSFTLLNVLTENCKIKSVTRILFFIQIHWHKMTSKVRVVYTIDSDGRFSFEDQFASLTLFPCLILCGEMYQVDRDNSDAKEEYISEFFSSLSKNTIRWGYKWRDCLIKRRGGEEGLNEISSKIINSIVQLKPMISQKSAVIIFQCFLYCLAQIVWQLIKNKHYANVYSKYEAFIKSLLEGLSEIIQQFNISYKDCPRSLCVFILSVKFLKFSISTSSSRVTIANLNLIKTAIKKYLSTDMALLVTKPETSPIFLLVNLLKTKLHDPEWSVRDSALEVLSVIAATSNVEFPSFKEALLEGSCCDLVLEISLVDGESFVRASAMKCLCEMVQIEEFWKNHFEHQDVIRKMLSALKAETEGTVRAQIVALLTTLLQFHLIHPETYGEVFASIRSATLDDLHWEVRLTSLSFWEHIIQHKLRKQGMVDGEFPKVTFSPELKKIVNLTEIEIQKRILLVLDQLSEVECLTVLKHSIMDDCDIQVSKKGLEISRILIDLIDKYKITEVASLEESNKPPLSNDSSYSSHVPSTPSPSSELNSNEIIEQILRVSDTVLLKDVYNPRDAVTAYNDASPQKTDSKRIVKVTTTEFLGLTLKNFKALVEGRTNWIDSLDSFSSLLNDMLESYEIESDANAMDCY